MVSLPARDKENRGGQHPPDAPLPSDQGDINGIALSSATVSTPPGYRTATGNLAPHAVYLHATASTLGLKVALGIVCVRARACTRAHMSVYVCMRVWVHECVYVCTHVHVCACMTVCVCVCKVLPARGVPGKQEPITLCSRRPWGSLDPRGSCLAKPHQLVRYHLCLISGVPRSSTAPSPSWTTSPRLRQGS